MTQSRSAAHNSTQTAAEESGIFESVRPGWLVGGDLRSNEWLVSTDDPNGRKRAKHILRFDVPVEPGPILLTDAMYSHDLLTCKNFVFWGLSDSIGWTSSSLVIQQDLASLINFIRWRNNQGIRCFRDLTRERFDRFVITIKTAGQSALLPYLERMEGFVEHLRSGSVICPTYRSDGSERVAMNEIAQKLGAGTSRQIPSEAWTPLLSYLKSSQPRLFKTVWRQVDENATKKIGLVEQRAGKILRPIDFLYRLSNKMSHDPVIFRAFDEERTCARVAKSIARTETNQTQVPDSGDVCALVDLCLKIVLDGKPIIRMITEVARDGMILFPIGENKFKRERERFYEQHLNRIRAWYGDLTRSILPDALLPMFRWSSETRGEALSGTDLRTFLFRIVPAACAVIIATFTGRRCSEIESLRKDCVFKDPVSDEMFISTWIEKTLRDIDRIPAPASVFRSVEMLQYLAEASTDEEIPWLFEFGEFRNGATTGFQFRRSLDILLSFAVSKGIGDSVLNIRPHQFRYFLAVTYYHRYKYKNFDALSRFMGHDHGESTRGYTLRSVRGSFINLQDEKAAERRRISRAIHFADARRDDFQTVSTGFRSEVVANALSGSRPIGGHGGKEWTTELERLTELAASTISIEPARAERDVPAELGLPQIIADWIRSQRLEPHPQGFGFCKCRHHPADKARAACLIAGRQGLQELNSTPSYDGPDFSRASDETCSKCVHQVMVPEHEAYYDEKIDEAQTVAKLGATEAGRARAAARYRTLVAHRARWFPRSEQLGAGAEQR